MRQRLSIRRFTTGIAAIACLATPASGRAGDEGAASIPLKPVSFSWADSMLKASMVFRDAVPPAVTTKLGTGLTTVIAMRAYVIPADESTPVALAVRTCRIVYDLWDEVYRVRITSSGGERDIAALTTEGVLRQCAEVRDLPIVDRSNLKQGRDYYLGVIVEVNPVSPAMLEQMRRWVARPTGATRIGPSDALFGSFVGLFVRQIGTSDHTLRFRTASFRG